MKITLLLFLSQHICWFLMEMLDLPKVLFWFSFLVCVCVCVCIHSTPLLFIYIYWGLFYTLSILKVSVIKDTMYLCSGTSYWDRIITGIKT